MPTDHPKVLLFAAGRGQRMRPLTDREPKPLLQVGGERLIERHLRRLAAVGVQEVVINLGWLGAQIPAALGDGSRYGLRIEYSDEGWPALETGGGLRQALPLLGDDPFLVVNGDVWTDYPFERLIAAAAAMPPEQWLHLVLVPNPPQHPQGDFELGGERLTASGLWAARGELLSDGQDSGAFSVAPYWRRAFDRGRATAERYDGRWFDIGTPARLAALDAQLEHEKND